MFRVISRAINYKALLVLCPGNIHVHMYNILSNTKAEVQNEKRKKITFNRWDAYIFFIMKYRFPDNKKTIKRSWRLRLLQTNLINMAYFPAWSKRQIV